MKKRFLSVLPVCAALAIVLCGCGDSHTHQTSDQWEADLSGHRKLCIDCGEVAEEEAHTLNEADQCTICGAQIVDWGDSLSLFQYNDNDELLKMADYDADGNVVTETTCQYEYTSNGLLTHSTATTDGVLAEECTYTVIDDESFLSQCISYMSDGSKYINDYDEHGNVIRLISYDTEGSVEYQGESEYALSADGMWYEAKCTSTEQDGSVNVSTFSEYGDQLSLIRYDADGNVLASLAWEYTYDEDGNWQTSKSYYDDVLTEEMVFKTVVTDDGSMTYPETVTEYYEDGSATVTTYDENGEVTSTVTVIE